MGRVTITLDQATGGHVPVPGAGLVCVTEAGSLVLTTATEGPCVELVTGYLSSNVHTYPRDSNPVSLKHI